MSEQRTQPMTAHTAPVCCDCDSVLCCAACGMEQPYDDISILKARIEELKGALREIQKIGGPMVSRISRDALSSADRGEGK